MTLHCPSCGKPTRVVQVVGQDPANHERTALEEGVWRRRKCPAGHLTYTAEIPLSLYEQIQKDAYG